MLEIKQFLSKKRDQIIISRQPYKFCFCFQRFFKLKIAEPPEDVKKLFNEYSDNGVMTTEKIHAFLVDFQGEKKATLDDAQTIFNHLKHHHVFQKRGLHLNAFFRYLLGDLNLPLSLGVHHDMEAPLAHYYMYTGHNSYLTGNQLSSTSSVLPIIDALRKGVRVIELDLWPNSQKNDAQVRHGGTMTSAVELKKCLMAIKEHAFSASLYPVIITFEDHLDSSILRRKVAEMVTSIFGEMLYPGVDFIEFPSPESLKRKILISTKPPSQTQTPDNLKIQENNKPKEKDTNATSIIILGDDDGSENEIKHAKQTKHTDMVEEEDGDIDTAKVPEYSNLIAVHAVKHKGKLGKLLKDNSNRVARLSLSEEKLEDAVKTYGTEIVRFTQRNLLRVYPKGTRIFSSNYDPMIGWMHGAQMVAFNMQGEGKYLWAMQGMFRANGNCGYIKKPDILLNEKEVFDPSTRRQVKKVLRVKVYMGEGWHLEFRRNSFDPFSPPDFFTKLEILGVPADQKKKRTVPIEDQWVPTWNQEFDFPLTVPELALLRIEVREFDTTRRHDFGGQTCLLISELKTGIRAVPLYDMKGEKYKHVRLLMRFQFI